MSKKYEQLIEYIINDEEDKAKELFHDIVVETSRDIYENLIDEEDYAEEETIEDMSDAIEADEEGISEEDDEMDMEMPMDMGDEEGNEEESEEAEEEELEDRVMDLEDALDELKAEFDQLMDGDEEEPEMESAESTEEPVAEEAVEEAKEEEVDEAKDEEVEESEDDESAEVVKEYVDKVAQPSNNSEAHKSPVAGKNDMGGKAVDPTGEEKGGSMPKVAPGKEYKNTAGGKAPMEKAPAPKTSGE
jgi:hypothetical protein